MQLSSRKPVTMSRTSLLISFRTLTTWTSLSCSTRTPLSLTPQFSRSRPTPRAKVRGAWYYSSFVPCCAARLFPAHLQSHFARYISTIVAKKRDASTELLQFLHAKMLEHNVDFIGGDFNMSAFSSVRDVFSDPEFSAPGHPCLWGLVRWMNNIVSALGSSSCPSAHMNGVWIHMAATSLTMQRLALDPGIILLTSLCSSTFATPIFLDPAVFCAVSKHNKGGMIANITNLSVPRNVVRDLASYRGDDHDCATVYQALLVATFPHTSEIACEPFLSLLLLLSSLTRGRFVSSLCLCPCLCLCLCQTNLHMRVARQTPPNRQKLCTLCAANSRGGSAAGRSATLEPSAR